MDQRIIIQNIVRALLLIVLQLTVFNNVNLFGYICPVVYVLFLLMLPTNMGRMAMLLTAFACGLCVDLANNMPGFHTAAATALMFCRITFLDKLLTRGEDIVVARPCFATVGFQNFAVYLLLSLLIYCTIYYLLVVFNFANPLLLLLLIGGNTAVTWTLCTLYLYLLHNKK